MHSFFYTLDHTISAWFYGLRSEAGISIFKFLTLFGSTTFIILFAILLALYLMWQKRYGLLAYFVGGLVVNEALVFLLKILVQRPRPLLAVIPEADFSFPSGHAAAALFFFGFLIWYATKNIYSPLWRSTTRIISLALIILIPISRLYLGEHYLTDVLASVCLAGAILLMVIKRADLA